MRRFLLVTNGRRDLTKVWDWQGGSPTGSVLPPVDLASISAAIRVSGGESRIADLRFSREPLAAFLRIIEEYRPDGVILNLTTTSADHDYTLIGVIPRGVARICFGTHAVCCAEEAFTKGVDYILVGDPEAAVRRVIETGTPIRAGDGVWTHGCTAGQPVYWESLDTLPTAAPSELDLRPYRMPFAPRGAPFWLILGARGGAPTDESSVHSALFGTIRRERSVERICDELAQGIEESGIRFFRFLDVDMNGSPGRAERLCAEVSRRGLRFEWAGELDVNTFDVRTAGILATSGLKWACLGISDSVSGDESCRVEVVAAYARAVKRLQHAGIRVGLTVRLSSDHSIGAADYVDRIVCDLQAIGADAVQCQLAMPFPGSAFRSRIESTGLDGRWSRYDPFGGSVPYATQVDLARARRSIHINWLLAHPVRTLKLAGRMAPRFVSTAGAEMIRREFWPDWQERRRQRMMKAAERLELEQVYSTSAIEDLPKAGEKTQGCGSGQKVAGATRVVQLGLPSRPNQ